MTITLRPTARAAAMATVVATAIALLTTPATAQNLDRLQAGAPQPLEITVTRPRLEQGLPGAAITVLTAQDIALSPAQSLPEFLSHQAGIQFRDLFGGTAGARATVDMRGFGAVGTQNTLILVNGRRLNDIDIAAVEFINIPLESIERVEIVRGNSAAVLYGDGAVGGAINIITRPGAVFSRGAVDGAVGTYGLREGNLSVVRAALGWSIGVDANATSSTGYRTNNKLSQRGAVVDLRRIVPGGEWFLRTTVDEQHLGLPGARRVTATSSLLATDPRGAATPSDFANQAGHRTVLGLSRVLQGGGELVIDGGLRVKAQDSVIISAFGPANDTTTNSRLSTLSFTPRLRTATGIAGIDYIYSDYNQIRRSGTGDVPVHRYDLKQHSLAAYGQNTFILGPKTTVSAGARVQQTRFNGGDILDPKAVITFNGSPYDGHRPSELHNDAAWAAHLGADHVLSTDLTLFGRLGRSFRAPTVDERVLSSPTYNSFRLRTQTSWDAETGLRWRTNRVEAEASAWIMNAQNELAYNANTFLNVNLDPTRRMGVEANASIALRPQWSLDLELGWIRARFRTGANAGKNVPLVSPWTGSAALRWQMSDALTVVGTVNGVSAKRMANDDANLGVKIPGSAILDLRITGARGLWRGSVQVNNLLDKHYFNYAVASASTPTTYNAYPLGGRTMRLEARRAF